MSYNSVKLAKIGFTLIFILAFLASASALVVKSTSPARNALNVVVDSNITVTFDANINRATLADTNFLVFGSMSGKNSGTFSYDYTNFIVTFDDSNNFQYGEIVTVILTRNIIQQSNSAPLDANIFQFTVDVSNGIGSFLSASTFSTEAVPINIAIADFNNDGYLDLAVANAGAVGNNADDNVSLFLGDGNGSFRPRIIAPVGDNPEDVVAADFNNDGKIDLVVANQDDQNISVLLGDGNGSFRPATEYLVGNNPQGIAVADFNSDGKLDIAVVNQNDDTVSILLGDGNGSFGAPTTLTAGNDPRFAVAADFNADGKIDLAITNSSDKNVSVFMGDGNGTFRPQAKYLVGTSPISIVASDFNNDGKIDLAVANNSSNTVSVLLGDGNGSFQAQIISPTTGGEDLFAIDLNADGKIDLVDSDADAYVLMSDGNGSFQGPITYTITGNVQSVVAADFNRDGSPDMVSANSGGSNVSIFMNADDANAPTISFRAPASDGNFNSTTQTVSFDVNDNQDVNLSTITLRLNGTSDDTFAPSNHCTRFTS